MHIVKLLGTVKAWLTHMFNLTVLYIIHALLILKNFFLKKQKIKIKYKHYNHRLFKLEKTLGATQINAWLKPHSTCEAGETRTHAVGKSPESRQAKSSLGPHTNWTKPELCAENVPWVSDMLECRHCDQHVLQHRDAQK